MDLLPLSSSTVPSGDEGGAAIDHRVYVSGQTSVRRRMATIVKRRLSEAQAAIPIVCRGLLPVAATGGVPVDHEQHPGGEPQAGQGQAGAAKARSGTKCVTLLQEALDIAMLVLKVRGAAGPCARAARVAPATKLLRDRLTQALGRLMTWRSRAWCAPSSVPPTMSVWQTSRVRSTIRSGMWEPRPHCPHCSLPQPSRPPMRLYACAPEFCCGSTGLTQRLSCP